ncbi:MAG: UDP-N-acetylmuramoyl-L-alanyl-D-glutamate--2,6-diaminopimelate ligase [Phycisphaerae bacterium]|nr:UDP-N-acetylmuramoyl-L-alanyl-D-glutamate--2,6-diaminopimelate ligase [Phycisphaerae bacterium]MDD5380160.1 UDP-N-acetylmuramoyl-L-alanyl-D-glutamate--2,6-diaminopimelate ligase [Phycisphaerae bacterium]
MVFDELLKLVSSNKAPVIRIDSRLVKAGDIFVAVVGAVCDGHDFISQAVTNGAKYIVCQRPCLHKGLETILVDDSAKAAAVLAQARSGNPASKLTNLAVTGTNGKTTVAFLVRSCIQIAGQKCGLVGTIIYDTGSETFEAPLTTPDCLTIAERQSQMLKAGAKYMVIEASSHALAQNRLAAVSFKAAAFTNLTGDHLDYHKTKEEYLAAKTNLFAGLSPQATAILNKQSPEAEKIAKKTKAKILWYAVDAPADITTHIESMDINGTVFSLEYVGQSSIVRTPLLGLHNVSNHLAAAGICLAAGLDLKTVAAGLSALKGVPGRLEKVDWNGDFAVLVDYAHTDDALKNVLSTLKPLCKGNLRVIFGCGGDRDRTKRPRMAKVVEQLADFAIVTSDNPRTENPQGIINEIAAGFKNPGSQKITIEPDRKKAIAMAMNTAGKNDIVLIAGKGHEDYQIIGKQKFGFSDNAVALECLTKRK